MRIADEQFESRITEALETSPLLQVPSSFAASVVQRVPLRSRPAYIRQPHTGQRTATASIAVLVALLLALMFTAPQTSFVACGLEPLLALQLGALVYWQFIRQAGTR